MAQLWDFIDKLSSSILAVGGAGAMFVALWKWFKKPDINRDEKLKGHDEMLDNDNKRIKELEEKQVDTEEALQILMKSMLALMSHSIDGNHTDELKKARDDMQEYLIRR
ncbi:MAG: hypothetical protein J5517_05820 [Eubacterium sp.]|nr:hypothetical protein [Eubacterium sp.]